MLCLMFHAGCNRYSLPVSDVVEVLPYMTLQRWPESPPSVAGMFVYRGQATAVIDLQHLAGQGSTEPLWNTRVLVLRRPHSDSDSISHAAAELTGLLVSRVSTYEPTDTEQGVGQLEGAWGPYAQDEQGLFQRLDIERLFKAALLVPAIPGEDQAGAQAAAGRIEP